MRRRLIVTIGYASTEQRNRIHLFIKESVGKGWWHWLPDTWLITTEDDDLTAKGIRDGVKRLAPRARCLVLELREDGTETWSGYNGKFYPSGSSRSMFDWIKSSWKSRTPYD